MNETERYKKLPAFGHQAINGMTIRDYFAIHALQAMLSNPAFVSISRDDITKSAIMHADKLIEELQKPKS